MGIGGFSLVKNIQKAGTLLHHEKTLSRRPPSIFTPKASYFSKARFVALFLVVVMFYAGNIQTVFALVEAKGPSASDIAKNATSKNPASHKTSTTPSIGKINLKSPSAPQSLKSKTVAAANAQPLDTPGSSSSSSSSSFLDKVADKVSSPAVSPALPRTTSKPTFTPHELVNARTADSTEALNKDGSITKTTYFSPHFYQSNGSWTPIDSTLVGDDNAADSGNIFGKALGKIESLVSSSDAFKTQANNWEARFTPSDFSGGMVRIKEGNSQVGFSPINANTVTPVISKDSNGQQVVTYSNLWNGIDIKYTVESDQVKEAVVINNKDAASQMQFKVIGADLQKPSKPSTATDPQPAFNITGALNNQFGVTPANLILNHYGFVDPTTSGLTQSYANGTLTVSVNSTYLDSLSSNAFPAIIDPTVFTESDFGGQGEGSFMSFEQGGPTCYSNTCPLLVGDEYDSNNVWQSWHGALFVPYNMFQQSGVSLTGAALRLNPPSTNVSQGFGQTAQIAAATCLTGYSCMGSTQDTSYLPDIGASVTNIYQSFISSGNWGGWLMLGADDGTGTATYNEYDPDTSFISFTYTTQLLPPTISTPQSGQTFTDPQTSFSVATETNPNNSTPLQYQFQVTDGSDGTGAMVNSGGFLDSTHWTVPDGVLQSGSTYYLEVQSHDPSTGYTSTWSTPVPFTINLRNGGDSTQTYDTVGAAKIDLGTGSVSTSTASHSTAALGGALGVSLAYNSSIKSSPGLVGSYWNLSSGGSGIPTTTAGLQRVDQNVDFNWNGNSPGSPIHSTYFAAQWNGYFVAPTAGSYTFGGVNDDSLSITVNGTQVYNNSGCSSSPCFGSSVSLTAGQVVSFQASYNQATGSDYAHIYVEGAVPEQVVPETWFQTGVRQVQTNGLLGHYYTYVDSGTPPTFPSNGTDGLFLTRVDPTINFNWTGNIPVTNGPQADWMTKWTGYITVPTTGSYVFGTQSDDGSVVTVNGTQVYSNWVDGSTTGYGTAITLTGGQSVPIVVQYYQHTGGNSMSLLVEPLGGSSEVVPSNWLTPTAPTLPAGWTLGIDPSGSVIYTHLTANANNAVLSDSTGDTYEYTKNGYLNETGINSGFKENGGAFIPDAGGSGFLNRNDDGTWTLQASDGKTYVFNQAGDLASVTSPADTHGNASLTYTYSNVNGTGPDAIQQITDGVNSNRWAKIYYGGSSQCSTPPTGFGSTPSNMLCAVETNDGRTTYFYYDTSGNLAEVAKPGNDNTSYLYDSVTNQGGGTIGYQLAGIRSDLANDAVVAGQRADNTTTYTQIQYDTLGRVSSVTTPAPTTGASQNTKTFVYTTGQTVEHISGATEPAGYSEKVLYDYQYRTTAVYNNLGQATTTVWDPVQDLQYSATSPEGLMSTKVYNDLGQIVSEYGPAPATDFNTWSWTLANGSSLSPGQSLTSQDGRFVLTFQTDGNVVLTGNSALTYPSGTLWQTNTSGQTATALTMGSDGNLVLYNGTTQVWSSGTSGNGSSTYLAVQNDGNAVLYNSTGPIWSTGTGGERPSPTPGSYDTPLSSYTGQVAHADTTYDQGVTGLSVNYFTVSDPSTDDASLTGAPRLHTTNIANNGTISHDWGSTSPISGYSGDWGFSMTGTFRLPMTQTGGESWDFQTQTDGGVRIWIDGQLCQDRWADNTSQSTSTWGCAFFGWVNNDIHTIRVDYYHRTVQNDAQFTLSVLPVNGPDSVSPVASAFSPSYGLTTGGTSYDSTFGNTTTSTGYSSDSGLGQVTSATIDPTGLDLTATDSYQTPGTGESMLTSQTAPGGATTSYSYYGASDTATNPCVSGSAAAYQAGMLKTTTNPSGQVVTNVYDDAGNIVASETDSDGWECRTYDARGRITEDVVPAYNGNASRTITYNYDVGGNPLVTSVTDSSGTITTTADLLGRTVSYTDNLGDTTTTVYDSLSRPTSQTSPAGTKTYTYNNYSQVTEIDFNGTDLAQPSYDAYGRLSSVAYPYAGTLGENVGYDSLTGAQTSVMYNTSDGITDADSDTLSQSGKVQYDVAGSGSNTLWYTYGYNAADELTSANVGPHTYTYGYGTENSSCASGTNTNAGLDGNRTSQNIDGTSAYYCYNSADQLVSSSNATADADQYDSHGNLTEIGSGSSPLRLYYDASDRVWGLVQYDGSGNGAAMYYGDDAEDRVTYREHDTISAWNWNMDGQYRYGYTDNSSSPALTYDSSWNITEEYVQLPGGVTATVLPQQTTKSSKYNYNLSTLQGNTLLTTDGNGNNTSNGNGPFGSFTYDPFGNPLAGSHDPNNLDYGSFGYKGADMKMTETALALTPIVMGARVYLPTIGRFTSEDPSPGSLPNLYTYPLDPINGSDVSGESLFGSIVSAVKKVAKTVAKVVAHVAAVVATTVVSVIKYAQTTARAAVPKPIPAVSSSAPAIAAAPPASPSQPADPPVSQIAESFDPQIVMVQSETNSSVLQPGPGSAGGGFGAVDAANIKAAVVGCIYGMAGEGVNAIAVTAAGFQPEFGVGVLAYGCGVGAASGVLDNYAPGSGTALGGADTAKTFYDSYNTYIIGGE